MTDRSAPGVPVWDPLVRIFHWSLAASIAVAWLSADDLKSLHEITGYIIAGLLAFRLVWGFVGPRHARFTDFVRGPSTVMAYLRDLLHGREKRFLGHNPAGAAMILALMTVTALTALSGWLQTTDMYWGSSAMQEIHEVLATLILFLLAGHVGGVVVESLRHRENLVRAMITGRKRPQTTEALPPRP